MLGIRDLSSEFKKLNSTGQSLTLEERMNLELSLTKIYEIEDFEEVLFWGKIRKVQVKEEGSHKISLYASFFSVYFAF